MKQMDTDKEGLKLDTSKERPFFLTIRFNRNLMNKNHIGRARLLPSRRRSEPRPPRDTAPVISGLTPERGG